jgi:hypothetical protein
MKISLELVRQVLKEALGFDSFVASFITEVREDKDHPTAGIAKDGALAYNPEFVSRYVTCKEDMFSLIFHELLHPMFGHFIYDSGEIENIAADAIINAVISTLYPDQSREGNLFKKTHNPRGLDGLMRPSSRMHNSRYRRVYEKLYPGMRRTEDTMTTGELIQTLKILAQTEELGAIMLLGTHDGRGNDDDNLSELPQEMLARFAEDIKRSLHENGGNQAGYSQNLMELFMEALRTHLSIRKALLQKFATKRKIDRFKELFQDRRISVSPIPVHPSKRDLVLLASGIWPCYFHNQLSKPQKRDRGLAIYLDVSGSVNEYLPKILGILKSLRKEVTTIFQFSNKVVETSFETLLKGNIQTTFGTDFNCIAQSLLERGFDKAVVITDGYASMSGDLKPQLKAHGLVTLTILFDDAQTCDDFAQFGDVVQLEDICE